MASKIKSYYEKQFLTFYTRIIYNVILQGEMQMNTKLLEDAINEYISLGINRQLDYDRFYLYSIITHSTAIESSADFIDFMFDHHTENIREQIEQYKLSLKNDTLNNTFDTINDTLNLTKKENAILELIKADKNIKTDDLIEKTGFSRPTIMRTIKSLKEKKLLEHLDSKKTGSWKVTL